MARQAIDLKSVCGRSSPQAMEKNTQAGKSYGMGEGADLRVQGDTLANPARTASSKMPRYRAHPAR
ncbi:hypothetical protein GCM10027565_26830 [Bordetella tumulicola]